MIEMVDSNLRIAGSRERSLELRHPRCLSNIKVRCKVVKNTNSLLSVVNGTTCFGLLRGHHKVQKC